MNRRPSRTCLLSRCSRAFTSHRPLNASFDIPQHPCFSLLDQHKTITNAMAESTAATTPNAAILTRFLGFPLTPGESRLSSYVDYPKVLRSKDTDVCFRLYDSDTRRWLGVQLTEVESPVPKTALLDDAKNKATREVLFKEIQEKIDNGVPLTFVVAKFDGTIVSNSSSPKKDVTPGTYYAPPAAYELPDIKTISRSELIELDRLAPFVDVVRPDSADPSEKLVFKHYESIEGLSVEWNTIQISARLQHPHIIPIRHLVLHEGRSGGVVGYTTPFIPSGNLSVNRTFKLKHAQQLFTLIDDLNLGHGIILKAIHSNPWKYFTIDPTTDNLILTSLGPDLFILSQPPNDSSPTTTNQPAEPSELNEFDQLYEDDTPSLKPPTPKPTTGTKPSLPPISIPFAQVTATTLQTLHHLLTSNPHSPSSHSTTPKHWTPTTILSTPWVPTPDLTLDKPITAYRDLALEWAKTRETRGDLTPSNTRTSASARDVKFPQWNTPEGETVPVKGKYWDPLWGTMREEGVVYVSGGAFYKRDAERAKREVVGWVRPGRGKVEEAKGGVVLLASGMWEAVYEGPEVGGSDAKAAGGSGETKPTKAE
ncbi:hypothetical protein QBC34DRAFT_498180 [Podospora aff. communis PSN243]|uniref:Protein kinase domain-containing protein n=1 Tax=Podospora aff. communis PSN243 TaxID=3040156 RepID=A0AAV9G829_9PEZI|nr:hypothetical protein QBC34DRAFT_498180 [Podospora aff. communis PSN243]